MVVLQQTKLEGRAKERETVIDITRMDKAQLVATHPMTWMQES